MDMIGSERGERESLPRLTSEGSEEDRPAKTGADPRCGGAPHSGARHGARR